MKIEEKLKNLKVIFLDADGVFFDGQETMAVTEDGKSYVSKSRSYQDGQGLSFLREMGIKIVFVSGEGEPLNSIVEKLNNLPSVLSGKWPIIEMFTEKNSKGAKMESIKNWLKENDSDTTDCAYMGDDMNDFEPMSFFNAKKGLTIASANATRKILSIVAIKLKKVGGKGAIRELAEMVIDARNEDETKFPPA